MPGQDLWDSCVRTRYRTYEATGAHSSISKGDVITERVRVYIFFDSILVKDVSFRIEGLWIFKVLCLAV
jgi:hypothetical protein